ncbi:nitroreductase family protein [Clostridioides difficile]|uniref:nitroreductase family protein n=1 Tax=Clostridioides difficile TaxID=1496 RepID=UPI001FAE0ABC
MQDFSACTQNLLLETTNQGLAAYWAGVFSKNKVRQALDLPVRLVHYIYRI